MFITRAFYWVSGLGFGVGLFASDITLIVCALGVAFCAAVIDVLN